MKKLLILGIIIFVLFSNFGLADIKCKNDKDCDDGLDYTKDKCINKGTEKSYCENEIKNTGISFLSKILDALNMLIDKDWIINVEPTPITIEPNITVEAPVVNLDPQINVTLPDKECKWEKYYQRIDFDIIDLVESQTTKTIEEDVIIGQDVGYAKLNILAVRGYTSKSDRPVVLTVNGITCNYISWNLAWIDFPCINALNEGINKFQVKTCNEAYCDFKLLTLLIEMQIKPANC